VGISGENATENIERLKCKFAVQFFKTLKPHFKFKINAYYVFI
jgi:hypothetical protein